MDDLRDSITNLNTQMTALLAVIQPLIAANAPDAAQGQPAPAALNAVTFALSPGTTNPDQLIDYSNRMQSIQHREVQAYGRRGREV